MDISIGAALLEALGSVERPGDFCVGGARPIFMPTLEVEGAGKISFPVPPEQAARLIAVAEAAPYGKGEETIVDPNVRRSWQIEPGRVHIGGRRWDQTLADLVSDAAEGLGINEPVAADFYKLLMPRDLASTSRSPPTSTSC